MGGRLSILHPAGVVATKTNPFGKDVANLQLFAALARHGGFDQVDVLTGGGADESTLRAALLGADPSPTRIVKTSMLNTAAPAQAGTLLRGQPDLYEMAWLRRRVEADLSYSLMGVVHTLAPPEIRHYIAMNLAGPVRPWDAIVCTSPCVQDGVRRLLEEWGDHLAERTGGTRPAS